MKLNLSELEELMKNIVQGEWKYDGEHFIICNSYPYPAENIKLTQYVNQPEGELIVALVNSFPSILRTIRCYEQAIEKVRKMRTRIEVMPDWYDPLDTRVNRQWTDQRDSILASLDKALKEIE